LVVCAPSGHEDAITVRAHRNAAGTVGAPGARQVGAAVAVRVVVARDPLLALRVGGVGAGWLGEPLLLVGNSHERSVLSGRAAVVGDGQSDGVGSCPPEPMRDGRRARRGLLLFPAAGQIPVVARQAPVAVIGRRRVEGAPQFGVALASEACDRQRVEGAR
jgi:hypothetical protein